MTPLRRLLAGAALGAVTVLAAACSEPAASDTATSDTGSGSGDTITVYTSEPQAKIDALTAAFTEETGIAVEVFRAGTGDLNARIASERATGSVAADVLLAADAPTFEGYKKDGLLLQYTPAEAGALNPDVVDPDGYYVGTRIIPTVIAYNTNDVTDPPTSWQDLTDPEYSERIVLPNPDVSGAAAYNVAVWSTTPGLGEPWIEALAGNRPVVAESNGPVAQAVAAGTQPVGIVVDYLVRELSAKGSPIALSYPTDGVPYVSQPAGIFSDSAQPEAAKKFVDFLIGRRGQELAVSQDYLPVRADVGTPDGAPALEDLELLTPDLEEITAVQPEAVRAFNALVG
ncbi:iron(III) transport system substrate-binding protein [Rhodococcus triatomae]|uniref:Iron(III) transport system substrate-binding protein n=1 Tax=Rhodococcus triatomae TaxID=300028 RepID=A0A1G8GSX5_9NOCA|nr:ABC transporter substrate-binding protein [Rhodococcus triatomae]SDH97371.1 iron(III) transport system substrate-binding protein [Rhodococcus triatomae]